MPAAARLQFVVDLPAAPFLTGAGRGPIVREMTSWLNATLGLEYAGLDAAVHSMAPVELPEGTSGALTTSERTGIAAALSAGFGSLQAFCAHPLHQSSSTCAGSPYASSQRRLLLCRRSEQGQRAAHMRCGVPSQSHGSSTRQGSRRGCRGGWIDVE